MSGNSVIIVKNSNNKNATNLVIGSGREFGKNGELQLQNSNKTENPSSPYRPASLLLHFLLN
jgi:hypothetical protein